ncbi:MAG: response regulator transcription factor [Chloroflexi bacterium]|nr:response regulator transcription factor [Chloroflexota bacterium]MDA8187155.1 response regulator transcription factor [Dehalococcoidales bacterium]
MKERILVIDDDSSITGVLRRGLGYEGYLVDVASDGKQGLERARVQPPDVVVLDIMMPGIDGLEVCRRLRTVDQRVPILMLTAKDTVSDQVLGLETGADDYIVKPFVFEVLLARVRALLRRREPEDDEVLRYEDLALDTASRSAKRGEREIELTTTEYELLLLLVRNSERVLTRDLIMEKVWGYDFEGNYNILEVYVRYLRNKLEEKGERRLIQTVRGAGYVLRDRE